jgi:asparagine synthetase B (glutamine-hydrolysing)
MFILVFKQRKVWRDGSINRLLPNGPNQAVNDDDWIFFWRDDETTRLIHHTDGFSFEIADQRFGKREMLVSWDRRARRMTINRPWPGGTSVYATKDRQILSSHLRFLAQVGEDIRPFPALLDPGVVITVDCSTSTTCIRESRPRITAGKPYDTMNRAALELREALAQAVRVLPRDAVLLLSGGIDSAALAAAAPFKIRSVTWTTTRALSSSGDDDELYFAAQVAQHLKLRHTILDLSAERVRANVDTAVLLSEVKRGTLIDDIVVYVEVARALRREGVRTVVIGEAADDALGCLPYNLRLRQGQELFHKLRYDYDVRAPADHAAISKTFYAFGIETIDPYLSASVAEVARRIPLNLRVDGKRLMKPVLRYAFREELPTSVLRRGKRVSRDVSGVKTIMAEHYGTSRDRFLARFNSLFRDHAAPTNQHEILASLN